MILDLIRYYQTKDSTLGGLYIDGNYECFTLEDIYRDKKVYAETRIPAGIYKIQLQTEGHMHAEYSKKFTFHKGMLWLQDVPDFTTIYIHIGNFAKDTKGCLLIGRSIINNTLNSSTIAYEQFYPKVIEEAEKKNLIIRIRDFDLEIQKSAQ